MLIQTIPVFKALADETRLQILGMLTRDEFCACKLLAHFHFSQPTLSYHMKILVESGLVRGMRDGSWMRYSLVPEKFAEVRGLLATFETGLPMALSDAAASDEAVFGDTASDEGQCASDACGRKNVS